MVPSTILIVLMKKHRPKHQTVMYQHHRAPNENDSNSSHRRFPNKSKSLWQSATRCEKSIRMAVIRVKTVSVMMTKIMMTNRTLKNHLTMNSQISRSNRAQCQRKTQLRLSKRRKSRRKRSRKSSPTHLKHTKVTWAMKVVSQSCATPKSSVAYSEFYALLIFRSKSPDTVAAAKWWSTHSWVAMHVQIESAQAVHTV